MTPIFRRSDDLTQQLSELTRRLETQHAESARTMRKIDELRQIVRANARAVRSLERARTRSTFDIARARALRQIEKLASSNRPLIVGPWYGEIGFETIYWAPFVRWALLDHGFDLGRVSIASRGDSRHVYGLDVPYVELFDFLKPHKLRGVKTGQQKQDTVRSLDRQLAHYAARQLGVRRPQLLHPAIMYAALAPFWDDVMSADQAITMLKPHRLSPPRLSDLPEEYAAVRFYSSRAFPDTPENRALADAVVDRLATTSHVVVLKSTTRFDDHGDLPLSPRPRASVIDVGHEAASNVGVQASVMAHSRLFVGTYGGTSYLAALCGVPVLGVWSNATWRRHHLALALAVFQMTNGGRFSIVSARELALLLGFKEKLL